VRFWRHVVERPKENHASVDVKLLRPSVDTALIEKMSIAGRMLETRAAVLSLRVQTSTDGEFAPRTRGAQLNEQRSNRTGQLERDS
jgi:hypothetical protein